MARTGRDRGRECRSRGGEARRGGRRGPAQGGGRLRHAGRRRDRRRAGTRRSAPSPRGDRAAHGRPRARRGDADPDDRGRRRSRRTRASRAARSSGTGAGRDRGHPREARTVDAAGNGADARHRQVGALLRCLREGLGPPAAGRCVARRAGGSRGDRAARGGEEGHSAARGGLWSRGHPAAHGFAGDRGLLPGSGARRRSRLAATAPRCGSQPALGRARFETCSVRVPARAGSRRQGRRATAAPDLRDRHEGRVAPRGRSRTGCPRLRLLGRVRDGQQGAQCDARRPGRPVHDDRHRHDGRARQRGARRSRPRRRAQCAHGTRPVGRLVAAGGGVVRAKAAEARADGGLRVLDAPAADRRRVGHANGRGGCGAGAAHAGGRSGFERTDGSEADDRELPRGRGARVDRGQRGRPVQAGRTRLPGGFVRAPVPRAAAFCRDRRAVGARARAGAAGRGEVVPPRDGGVLDASGGRAGPAAVVRGLRQGTRADRLGDAHLGRGEIQKQDGGDVDRLLAAGCGRRVGRRQPRGVDRGAGEGVPGAGERRGGCARSHGSAAQEGLARSRCDERPAGIRRARATGPGQAAGPARLPGERSARRWTGRVRAAGRGRRRRFVLRAGRMRRGHVVGSRRQGEAAVA